MGRYVVRRMLYMVPTLFLISLVAFAIIQLPPGDFLSTVVAREQARGGMIEPAYLEALRARYALDQPMFVQYWTWISNIAFRGDFGQSFQHGESVSDLLAERLPLTLAISLSTMLIGWCVSLPLGVFSAVRRYTWGDYVVTTFVFFAVAIPNFLAALAISYVQFRYFGASIGGLFSPQFVDAEWNIGRILDLLGHLWVPILVLGLGGIAGTIRIMRANLLDELSKPYVVTARSKGVPEGRLIWKYPVRVALNPFVSTIGWALPGIVGGEIIVSQILGLQTTGPLLLSALESQDMYLAGSIILILSALTVVGTLISDLLLGVVDPRIREGRG